jgi:hypothetical protein
MRINAVGVERRIYEIIVRVIVGVRVIVRVRRIIRKIRGMG